MHVRKLSTKLFSFVGYCENTKEYGPIHLVTRLVTIGRDVFCVKNESVRNICSAEELHERVEDVFPSFEDKLDSLLPNNTWKFTELPPCGDPLQM